MRRDIGAISCLFEALDSRKSFGIRGFGGEVAKVLLPFWVKEFRAIQGDRYLQGGREPNGLFILCYNEVTEC